MRLDDNVIKKFSTAKLFKDFQGRINNLNFTSDGLSLIASSDDDSIVIYDCQNGTRKRQVNSKKYGVDLIQFARSPDKAIHASNKVDDTIRYLSLPDSKYLRYFQGHTKRVVQLSMSPIDDVFISGSLDKQIRIWDLRSQNCQGGVMATSRPVVAFDPEGLLFAVGQNSDQIKLYDLRTFDKAPFIIFKIPKTEKDIEWTSIKFSPDGKQIMITTNKSCILLIDSFTGKILHTLTGHLTNKSVNLEASYSPDSAYVFSGSADGKIFVWSADNGRLISALLSMHSTPMQCVVFNPKQMLLATACSQLCLWLPHDVEED